MFKKFLLQFFLFLLIAGLLWLGIRQINLYKAARIDERIEKLEERLGDLFLNIFAQQHRQITEPEVHEYLEYLTSEIFQKNNIDRESIDIYLLRSKTVNAFALPGRNIILLSGLIDYTETPEQLIGVIAHEIAHLEADHVMKKLSREVGIAVLLAAVSGNYNMELLREVAKMIASNSYSRAIETEADLMAMEYMINAGINPRGLIDLFKRFGEDFDILPSELQWLGTHPASEDRANQLKKKLEELAHTDFKVFDAEEWEQFKERLENP